MKRLSGEARVLAALYLVFALLLCGLGSDPVAPVVTASTPTLRSDEERENPLAAVAAVLERLGFSRIPQPGPLRPRPINYTVAAWEARKPVARPAVLLVRAGGELVSSLAERGGRLLRMEWVGSGTRLGLNLELALPGERGFLFSLTAAGGEKESLLRKRPTAQLPVPPPSLHPRPPSPPTGPPTPPRPARVAIVLDDVGETMGLEKFLALPIPLTIAIMPKRRHSEAYARMARAAGREVLLHLPLEAQNGQDPGPGVIRTDWPPERVREELEEDLASVPGAVGVNNHMGSLGTADETLMRMILGILKEKGLFFLDSRTTAGSVVPRVAGEIGLRYAVNGKFLDPEGASIERIQELIRELIALAKRKGKAVGICHANRPHTLAALRTMLPEFAAAGVELVPLGQIVGE
ncbi:MAG: divergent polysaccharide deacetylase family protein [Firmicutes bacterium]|nr:divergent polysaccharide deacetylase family protein [Bacillota bacterium]